LSAVQEHYGEANKSNGLSECKTIDMFLKSRREGFLSRIIEFYSCYPTKDIHVLGITPKPGKLTTFLSRLHCSEGGKHAYFRAMKVFCNWLYSAIVVNFRTTGGMA